MPVSIKGSGGGGVTLDAGAAAATTTLTLPNVSGTVATTTGTLTNPTINGFTGNTSVVNIGSGQIYKDASGNVGIGTSSPITKLDVLGNINFGPSDGSCVAVGTTNTFTPSGGSPTAYYGMTFGGFTTNSISLSGYNGIAMYTNAGLERARITSGGNLLVNTTNAAVGIGDLTTVNGAQLAPEGYVGASRANEGAGYFTRTGSDGRLLHFYRQSTNVGGVTVTTTSTSFNTSSDYRLKTDVQPMTTGLSTIAALKPVTYKWIANDSYGEGFIAHELQETIPLAVDGEKDAIDANGNIIAQSVDYSKVVVHLVAAIQELKAELDAAKAEIAILKGAA